MRIFKKSPKVVPIISIKGVEVKYQISARLWEFVYRDQLFTAFESEFVLPSFDDLDSILCEINSITDEMETRIKKGWEEWGEVSTDDGESFLVTLDAWASDKSYLITWSGGRSWGDMTIDFTIRNGQIIEEEWGD